MTQMMEARRARIADGLAAADQGKRDLEVAEQRVAERLRDAKQDGADILTAAHKRANEMVEEAKEQARIEGQHQLAAAVAEIEQESNRAKEELRRHFGNLVLATAEKVLEREVNTEAHNEFIDKMVKKL
jgi:F-type H+-transporting ATPase subunit b